MAGYGLLLFACILAFSFLISSNDLPVSRAQEIKATPSQGDTSQMSGGIENVRDNIEKVEVEFTHGRLDLEFDRDYTGTGANNRHTPNPPTKD